MSIVLKGTEIAYNLENAIRKDVKRLKRFGINPALTIFTNEDPSSKVYLKNQLKKGNDLGIEFETIPLSTYDLSSLICRLNNINHPFIIQLPCVYSESINSIMEQRPQDVDGFNCVNLGRMLIKSKHRIIPPTAMAVIQLLNHYELMDKIKKVTVIGRSQVAGKPIALLLSEDYNKTVTICHSYTSEKDLYNYCLNSDLIVSAVGKPNMLSSLDTTNKILIDVGINKGKDGKIRGDFSSNILEKSFAYSPVPGGVGALTTINLYKNVVEYYKERY